MARGVAVAIERRGTPRVTLDHTPWHPYALLRPGQDVVVLNLGAGGALVQSPDHMNPGARTELQLLGPTRRLVKGRIERCHVTTLAPLRYEGAIVFDDHLDWSKGSG